MTDHLGSVRDVVDNSGVSQNHIVYDAFGNITSQSNSSVIFRFGYTAREFDAESGLQYNRGRYLFDGRFISEDPSGFDGGDTNLYRYVGNNSVNLFDPEGLQARPLPQYRPPLRIVPNPLRPVPNPLRVSPNPPPPINSPFRNPNPFNPFQAPPISDPLRTPVPKTQFPFTPTFPTAPGELFIPPRRSGNPRKSTKKKIPDPNVCEVPNKKCSNSIPTFFEDPSLEEHYTLVATAIQRLTVR